LADGIRIEGLPELQKIMQRVGSLQPVKNGLKSAALHVKGKIAQYPPVSRRPQPFVSDLQRRGFFAKLRSGQIEVPYRRGISSQSQRLGQSWTIKEQKAGLTQVIGSDTTYGPLVQAKESQTRYHKETGWKTTETVIERETAEVNRIVKSVVDAALEGKNA
jgi:hypothetical protein